MNLDVPDASQNDKSSSEQEKKGKSKAQLIRELLKDSPKRTSSEIVAALSEWGIQVNDSYVRHVKSETKKKSKKKDLTQIQRSKKTQKNSKQSIPRTYPRATLEDTLKIAAAIKNLNGGNPWHPDEIANALEVGAKSNKFYYLTSSSRDYGLTDGIARSSKPIQLAEIGAAIVYAPSPSQEGEAIQNAFFNIPLFKLVYEYYNNGELPELKYLSNTLETKFAIPREYHAEFIEVYNANRQYVHRRISELGGASNREPIVKQTGGTIKFDSPTVNSSILAFVAMPFSEKTESYPVGFYNEVFNSLIIPAASEAGFRVETARKDGSDIIQSTIVKRLLDADLVIADLSDHNPNVLFELGLRLAAEKPTALIRAKGTKPIFDVDNMLRVYDYNPNLWKSTIEIDLPALTAHIIATWENRGKDVTYMRLLRGD